MFVASEHAWGVLARVVIERGGGTDHWVWHRRCSSTRWTFGLGDVSWGLGAGGGGTHCRLKRLVEGMSPLLVAAEGVVELCACVVGEHDDQIR